MQMNDNLYYDIKELMQYLVFSDDPIVDNNIAEKFLRELEEVE